MLLINPDICLIKIMTLKNENIINNEVFLVILRIRLQIYFDGTEKLIDLFLSKIIQRKKITETLQSKQFVTLNELSPP